MTFGSKAAFRAARERCGISQKMLADRFGNAVLTVKRWEKPGEAEPPADVQAWLESMLTQHVEAVEAALDAVDGIEEVQATRLTMLTCSTIVRRNTTTVTDGTKAITRSSMPAAGR